MPNSYGSYSYAAEEYAGPPAGNVPGPETNGGLFPLVFVEFGFGAGSLDENPTWVDVSARVLGWKTRRGRQHVLSKMQAGTASITLDNRDGALSPFNTSSPYSGDVVPGVPVRIRGLWNGLPFPLFRGTVESWGLAWLSANDSEITVEAVDTFKQLNLKKAATLSQYAATVLGDNPQLYWRLGDQPGSSTAADSSGNGNDGTATTVGVGGGDPWFFGADGVIVADPSTAFDGGTEDGAVVGPVSVTQAAVSVEVWAKLRSLPTSGFEGIGAAANIVTLDQSLGTDQKINIAVNNSFSSMESGVAYLHIDTGITVADVPSQVDIGGDWHHYVATSDGSDYRLYVDGVLQVTHTVSSSAALDTLTVGGIDGIVDETAVYGHVLSGAQVAAHYAAGVRPRAAELSGTRVAVYLDAVGWPAGLRRVDAGLTPVQAAGKDAISRTVLANLQDVATTENGEVFIDTAGRVAFFDRGHTGLSPYSAVSLILGDSGVPPEEPYVLDGTGVVFDDADIYNEVVVTPAGAGPQIAADPTSQARYGTRTLTVGTLHYHTGQALLLAETHLAAYNTPAPRVAAISVTPMSDPTMLFGPVLGFDLFTRIEVRRQPMDGSGSFFDQESFIEGIEHQVTKATWRTTWRLSPTPEQPEDYGSYVAGY